MCTHWVVVIENPSSIYYIPLFQDNTSHLQPAEQPRFSHTTYQPCCHCIFFPEPKFCSPTQATMGLIHFFKEMVFCCQNFLTYCEKKMCYWSRKTYEIQEIYCGNSRWKNIIHVWFNPIVYGIPVTQFDLVFMIIRWYEAALYGN